MKDRNIDERFNVIMPQSTDRLLCIQVEKPITEDGYKQNFIKRIDEMHEKHGEIRILVYYKDYKGWEKGAALQDMHATLTHGPKVAKIALVDPPEKEIFKNKLRQSMSGTMVNTKIELFKKEQLDEAIKWAQS